jgi:hypothetical protein
MVFALSTFAMDLLECRVERNSFIVMQQLEPLELYHMNNRFFILKNEKMSYIRGCCTDPLIRNLTPEELLSFKKRGYLIVDRTNYGEFSISARLY